MATRGNNNPTLMDFARREGPDGKIAKIVELLHQTNEVIHDMSFVEGNLPTGHKTTVRTGLPSAAWRQLNYGVQPSKSQTKQVTDVTGMLEAYAEVDKELADLNGNTAEFRLSEDRAFLEAMNQEMTSALFYGDTTVDPKKFNGLDMRYNYLSDDESQAGSNVIDGGGTGNDNTSVWLVVWGPNTVHGILPKGSKAGFTHKDLGEVTLEDPDGGKFQGYRSHYQWKCGLSVRDWRYVARLANIDVSELTKDGSTGADLIDLLVQLTELPPNLGMGRPVLYCNKTIRSFLRRQITNKDNVYLTLENYSGKKVVEFDGIPIKRCDSILKTEAQITA